MTNKQIITNIHEHTRYERGKLISNSSEIITLINYYRFFLYKWFLISLCLLGVSWQIYF